MSDITESQGYPCEGGSPGSPCTEGSPGSPCRNPDRSCGCSDNLANSMIDSVHRRNVSTMASPVILLFDGFHSILYQIFLGSRYLLTMVILLVRITLSEILKPRTEEDKVESDLTSITHITENKLCELEISKPRSQAVKTIISYKSEAENYALQHQVELRYRVNHKG